MIPESSLVLRNNYTNADWQTIVHYKSWAYIAGNINARTFASIPLRLKNSKGVEIKGKLLEIFATENHSANEFFFKLCLYLHFSNCAYVQVQKNGLGEPVELFLLPSQYVRPQLREGEFVGVQAGYAFQNFIPAEDIIRFKFPSLGTRQDPSGLVLGYCPAAAIIDDLVIDGLTQKYDERYFRAFGRPSAFIEAPEKLSDDQQAQLIASLHAFFADDSNIDIPLLLDGKGTIKPFPMGGSDKGQYSSGGDSTRNLILWKISSAFGVPLSLISSGSLAGGVSQQDQKLHLQQTIIPLCKLVEGQLNQYLVKRYFPDADFCFAFDNQYPNAIQDLTDTLELFNSGIITREEAREQLGYEPPPAEQIDNTDTTPEPLNGAQIQAALQVIESLSLGIMGKEAGKNLLIAAGLSPQQSEAVVRDVPIKGNNENQN